MNSTVRKRIAIVIGFAAVAAVASQVLFAQPKPNHSAISTTLLASFAPPALVSASPASGATSTQPKITWSTTSISVILSPGESTSSSLTFTSSQKLSSASLSVVPQIAPFVTAQPNSIANVAANQAQSVQLLFSIPANATLGIYNGTLQLKSGTTTFPQTVKITVNVWQSFASSSLGVSLKYPPGWFAEETTNAVTFSNVQVPGSISDTSLQTQSFLEIRLLSQANTSLLPIASWFAQYFSQGFSAAPISTTTVTVSGHSAVVIETSEIGRRLHYYIEDQADIIEVSYGIFARTFVSQYQGMLQTIQIN